MSYTEEQYEEFSSKMETKFPTLFGEYYGGFAVGAGWWSIIESLCSVIQNHIDNVESTREWSKKNDPEFIPESVPPVTVAQIKEKFGGLRFYYDGGDEYIRGAVRMAEYMADQTCEECGAPGKHRTGGWIRTLCDVHEAERQSRMIKA